MKTYETGYDDGRDVRPLPSHVIPQVGGVDTRLVPTATTGDCRCVLGKPGAPTRRRSHSTSASAWGDTNKRGYRLGVECSSGWPPRGCHNCPVIEVLATHITIGWAHPRLVSELYPGVLTVEGTRGVILVLNYSHHIVPLPEGERRAFTVDDETVKLGAQRYVDQVEQAAMERELAAIVDTDGSRIAECVWPPRWWTSRAVFPPPPTADTLQDS